MRSNRLLGVTWSVLALLGESALAQTPATANAPATGPVALYEQAMALIRETPDETNYLDDVRLTPLNANTARFLAARKPVVDLLKQASALPAEECCDVPADIDSAMKSLNSPRSGAALLLLQARQDLHDNKPADAVSDYVASLAFARHIGQRRLLVARLVECGMETQTVKSLAENLPQLPRASVEALRTQMKNLPPRVSFADTLAAERDFGLATARTQGNPMTANLEAFYKGIIPAADGKPAEYRDAIAKQMKLFEFDMMIKILAPSLERANEPLNVSRVSRTMLETAVDIVLDGQDAVKQSKDPYGDGPFRYEIFQDGFVLTSALIQRGKPVTLFVGPGGE